MYRPGPMICRGGIPLAAMACLIVSSYSIPALGQTSPRLIVSPAKGRPNDDFYLAGGGFPPSQPLTVTMYCRDWMYNANGRWSWTIPVGPAGTFIRFHATVPTPLLVPETPCVIRARDGDNLFGVGVAFYIARADQPLQRQIPLKVQVKQGQDKGNPVEMVSVSSAPGARVMLHVLVADKNDAFGASLPWNGQTVMKVPLPRQSKAARAELRLNAKLGNLTSPQRVVWLALRAALPRARGRM